MMDLEGALVRATAGSVHRAPSDVRALPVAREVHRVAGPGRWVTAYSGAVDRAGTHPKFRTLCGH
ncbi:hypothetical protein [Streptomyces sp. cg35]|uniref:hypothetical protein n=1 Tax=Streptomyces sp. cg35 TaxID=3421650 RepID=UPI003D180303